jgi:hypothetical protein
MTLPSRRAKHLILTLDKLYNPIVENWFKTEATLNTKRGSLKVASLVKKDDSLLLVIARLLVFHFLVGYFKDGLSVVFGSKDKYDPPVQGHPIVYLFFSQDAASTPSGESKVEAEYSFRLMDETQATFTEAKATALATEIKNLFLSNGKGLRMTKGKNQYIYFHKERGYRLRIYSTSEADAVDVIKKMLQLTNTSYDEDRLSIGTPKRNNFQRSQKQLVYGKQVKIKRYRPTANVYFRYAYVEIPGKPKPVFLVDTTFNNTALVFTR